jgi:Spy/CpxP family protein refolding chaperone
MKRLLVTLLLVSLGLNVGLAVRLRQAGGEEQPRMQHAGRMMPAPGDSQAWHARMERRLDRMSEHLGLSPQQRDQLARHRAVVESQVRLRMVRLDETRTMLRAEAERRPPDPTAVAAALGAVSRAEAELDSLVAVNLQAELELLSPEQQAEMLRLMPFERLGGRGLFGGARGEGPGSGRGHHRRPGGGPAPGE